MARAARLELGILVTLRWIEFFVPRDGPVSQRDAVSVVATLLQGKGPMGFVRIEAWWS